MDQMNMNQMIAALESSRSLSSGLYRRLRDHTGSADLVQLFCRQQNEIATSARGLGRCLQQNMLHHPSLPPVGNRTPPRERLLRDRKCRKIVIAAQSITSRQFITIEKSLQTMRCFLLTIIRQIQRRDISTEQLLCFVAGQGLD